jgi:hypothetical protein
VQSASWQAVCRASAIVPVTGPGSLAAPDPGSQPSAPHGGPEALAWLAEGSGDLVAGGAAGGGGAAPRVVAGAGEDSGGGRRTCGLVVSARVGRAGAGATLDGRRGRAASAGRVDRRAVTARAWRGGAALASGASMPIRSTPLLGGVGDGQSWKRNAPGETTIGTTTAATSRAASGTLASSAFAVLIHVRYRRL